MADNKDIIEQVTGEATDKAADKKAAAKKSGQGLRKYEQEWRPLP